jgi:hypothetical protein
LKSLLSKDELEVMQKKQKDRPRDDDARHHPRLP